MKKKILLSGGRAPYTLELLRIFAKEGHEVHILEFIKNSLCEYSKFTQKTHIITAPNTNEKQFKVELLKLLKRNQFDYLIPTCEEALYLSKYKDNFDQFTKTIVSNFDIIYCFHHKDLFNKFLKENKFPFPKTYTSPKELEDQDRYILKKKLSRFGTHVIRKNGNEIKKLNPSEEYLIQEELTGMEYCLYIIAVKGNINAISIYPKQFSINGGATNYFESIDHPIIEKWADQFISSQSLSGQFSFDLFIKNDQAMAIECNPRTTSGVHLLRDRLKLEHFIKPSNKIRPHQNSNYMLLIPVLLFNFNPFKNKNLLQKFLQAKDVIYMKDDLWPLIGQVLSLFSFAKLAIKHRLPLVDATTIDIEYNKSKEES